MVTDGDRQPLRVAVVGGGAAGMASALHLAALFEQPSVSSHSAVSTTTMKSCLEAPIDMFNIPMPLRDIGVGLWSTALDPFRKSTRASHQQLYQELVETGTWIGSVGYRIPSGQWLMKSHLPESTQEQDATGMPALLFLRERDMIMAMQRAIDREQAAGTIQLHASTRVTGLQEDSPQPWSTKLLLGSSSPQSFSERDYHLIVAADGTHSILRSMYAGYQGAGSGRMLTVAGVPSPNLPRGGAALPGPIELPQFQTEWNTAQQKEAVGLQDRAYTVFRGNASLTAAELGILDEKGHAISFQTWGEGRSMRFATVPLHHPSDNNTSDKKEEKQVWFITINDDKCTSETDPVKRRGLLLQAFQNWHDPIQRILLATPPDQILMERAVAHCHAVPPVLNFNQVIQQIRGERPPSRHGEGPAIVFIGDAYMTVDPILAQGFTVALEGAHVLAKSVQAAVKADVSSSPLSSSSASSYYVDPFLLRVELKARADIRIDRLICLLRATELVQALGQPNASINRLHTHALRPLVRLIPNVIKAPIFDLVLKYSLGVHRKRKTEG